MLAFGPDGSTAQGTFDVPLHETELDNFVLRVGRPRRSVRAFRSPQMEEAKRFGSQLFETLLQGDVREVYRGARQVAESRERGLRVTLYLTGVPQLMGALLTHCAQLGKYHFGWQGTESPFSRTHLARLRYIYVGVTGPNVLQMFCEDGSS